MVLAPFPSGPHSSIYNLRVFQISTTCLLTYSNNTVSSSKSTSGSQMKFSPFFLLVIFSPTFAQVIFNQVVWQSQALGGGRLTRVRISPFTASRSIK